MKGSIAIIILLCVIIIGSIILVGGPYPIISNERLNLNNQKTFEQDIDPTITGKPKNLQLQISELRNCSDTLAVEFLLDTSGSMKNGDKTNDLKEALNFFVDKLKKNAVIGIRNFSSTTYLQVPFDFYEKNQPSVKSIITNLNPDGGTSTRDAFIETHKDLKEAILKPEFKNYAFNLIFFSDGIPETLDGNTNTIGRKCKQNPRVSSGYRCFDERQDPTNTSLTGGDIAQQIKNLKNKDGKNIRIFSVLLFDPVTDKEFEEEEEAIMKRVASSTNDFYKTTNQEYLINIFQQIKTQVCN